MAETQTAVEFQFVNSTISCPSVPQDLAIRSLIRKQAMKKASAARKRDGNYGKHNLRQYPVFLFDHDAATREATAEQWDQGRDFAYNKPRLPRTKEDKKPSSEANTKRVRSKPTKTEKGAAEQEQLVKGLALVESVPAYPSAQGYELTSMKTDFDLLVLSTLATLHLTRAVRSALSQNPYHLILQLRSHKRWSYLSFLPTRYEDNTCLKDATDCVIARTRQIISPNTSLEPVVIKRYVKALASLQLALDCPQQRFQPEVLCATEVLALYELLDPSGETAWVRHAAGAAKLIQLRGPETYNSDFEKALFMAQTVPITTEALANGERCFLEQPAWQETLKSMIEPDTLISDRSEIVVSLLMFKSNIPGFFVDVTNVICVDMKPHPKYLSMLASRIRQLRTNFLNWNSRYQAVLSQCPDMEIGSANHDSHCKVFSNYLSCVMITSRMLVAVSPSDREEVEKVTQALARQGIELDSEVKASPTNLFMAQTFAVASAVIATADDWSGKPDAADSDGLIERWKLERWCKLFGRKMPSN